MREITVEWATYLDCMTNTSSWVERFVEYRGKPIHLYQFQKDWYNMGVDVDRYGVKARQLGFSFASAMEAVKTAMTRNNILIILISIGQKQADELMAKCAKAYYGLPDMVHVTNVPASFASAMGVDGNVIHVPRMGCKIITSEMSFTNSSQIVSLPNNAEAVRGYTVGGGAVVYWDEAAKFEHELKMHAALEPCTTRGGHVSFISTHRGTQTLFFENSQKARKGELEDSKYLEVPWWEIDKAEYREDPILQEEVNAYIKKVRQFERRYGAKSFFFLEEYCCVASDESLAMFTHEMLERAAGVWKKKGCQLPQAPTGKNPIFAGIDIGRTKDATCFYAIEDMGEYARLIEAKEWIGVPFEEQKMLLEAEIRRLNATAVRVDNGGLGKDTAEWLTMKFGARIEPIDFVAEQKEQMVLATYVQMQNNKIAIPDENENELMAKLHAQLHNVRREITIAGRIARYVPAEETMHDDHQWAFCLAGSLLRDSLEEYVAYAIGPKESRMIKADGMEIFKTIEESPGDITPETIRSERAKKESEEATRKTFFQPKKTMAHEGCGGTWVLQVAHGDSDEYACDKCGASKVRIR